MPNAWRDYVDLIFAFYNKGGIKKCFYLMC